MSSERWTRGRCAEPALSELLEDPLILALMRSDGVEPAWLRAFLVETARRLGFSRPLPSHSRPDRPG